MGWKERSSAKIEKGHLHLSLDIYHIPWSVNRFKEIVGNYQTNKMEKEKICLFDGESLCGLGVE